MARVVVGLAALATVAVAAVLQFGPLNGFAVVAAIWLLMPEARG